MEKSVDQKLKECKTVIIQSVEKSMQRTMIYRYLKQEKIDIDIDGFTHNSKDGYITIEFKDHEKAKQYYDKANFKDKILFRPFNIYFNVQLNENEMKKYYFDGVAEQTLRQMFDIARKVGICKVYTSYTNASSSAKLKPTGVLSFVRKDPITEAEFNTLKQELSTIGIKINPYTPEKGLKCAVILTDFYKGDLNQAENVIEKNAQQQATKLIKQFVKDESNLNITGIVKRKQIPNPEGKQGTKIVTKVKALVQFNDYDSAINTFEQIRKGFISIPDAKAVLNFYASETSSYISLFTRGLIKPQGKETLTDKQFEDLLVDTLRKVNKDVVQVNVFPNGLTYVARVYLKSQDAGRYFIADYANSRAILAPFYKNNNNLQFNMNVDDKTMKKIKQLEKKAGQILSGIKNQTDKNKMYQKGTHNMPMGNFGMMNPMPHLPNMMMPPPNKMPNMGTPMTMPMGNMPTFPMGGMNAPMPQMGGLMPMGMPASNIPSVMNPGALGPRPQPQQNIHTQTRAKIDKLFNQKAYFVDNSKEDPDFERNAKKTQFFPLVTFVLQNDLKLNASQSGIQSSKILQSNDLSAILDFLKNPMENYNKVFKA